MASPWIEPRRLRELSQIRSGPFLRAAAFDWAVIASAISAALYFDSGLVYFAAAVIIAGRQHALLVLAHEGAHYRVHSKLWINDGLSDWLCAFPGFIDTRLYRRNHLAHHKHTNTDQDPDWIRKKGLPDWQFPVSRKQLLWFWIKYPLQGWREWVLFMYMFSGLNKRTFMQKGSYHLLALKSAYWLAAFALINWTGGWNVFLGLWLAPYLFIFPAIQRLRSQAEHFAMTYADELNSTRDVVAGPIERFLFAPHYIGLHLAHHLYPSVPFFRLKELHHSLLENPNFASTAHENASYVWPSARSVVDDLTAPPKHKLENQNQTPKAS